MVKTIADLEVNPNTPLASGIIETKSRIRSIGGLAEQKVDSSMTMAPRSKQIKQLGIRKKPTD